MMSGQYKALTGIASARGMTSDQFNAQPGIATGAVIDSAAQSQTRADPARNVRRHERRRTGHRVGTRSLRWRRTWAAANAAVVTFIQEDSGANG